MLHNKRKVVNYPNTYKNGDIVVNDETNIANGFNDFFVNIGPSLAKNIHSNSNPDHFLFNSSSCVISPVSEEEFLKVATTSQ